MESMQNFAQANKLTIEHQSGWYFWSPSATRMHFINWLAMVIHRQPSSHPFEYRPF